MFRSSINKTIKNNNIRLFPVLALTLALLIGCTDTGSADTNENLVQVRAYLDLAEVYRDQGQFRAAIIETRNAFQIMPENLDTQLFIADLYLELGDVAQATEHLTAANEAAPDNVDVTLALAEAYLYSNKVQQSLELISDLNTAPGEQENKKNWLRGSLLAATGDIEGARQAFDTVLAADSNHVDSLVSLSRLAWLEQDPEQAEAYAEEAAALASRDNVDLLIWQGQMALLQEDYPAAEEAYIAALDIMGEYDTMTAKRFNTLQSVLVPLQMQQKNDAVLRYSEIIASTPQGELNNTYSNALSLLQEGSLEEAEAELGNLLSRAPNHPGSNILLGMSRYQQGDYREAERLLSEFVDTDTASPQLIRTLAATHLRQDNPDRALSVLQEALNNYPEDTALLAMTGIIHRSMGNVDQAISVLNEALAQEESAELHYTLAASYAQRQELDQALAHLELAVEQNAELTQAKAAILDIYAAREQPGLAAEATREWLADDPDSIFNHLAAGQEAIRSENTGAARSHFEAALELDNVSPQARLNLARLDLLEEDYDAAAEHYNALIAAQPNNANAISGLLAIGDLTNSPQAGIDRVESIIRDNPEEFVPPLVLAQYYLVSEDLDNARTHAEAALAVNRNNYTENVSLEIIARQAVQEIQAENFPAAEQTIAELKEIQPAAPYIYEMEGDMYAAQNRPEDALAAYEQAWERQHSGSVGLKIYQISRSLGHDGPAREFLTAWVGAQSTVDGESQAADPAPLLLMAMDLQTSNRNAEAIGFYEQVESLQPDNMVMLNNLAWLYQESDPTRALELSSRAAELYPENADVLDTYGWILFQQDRRDEAIDVLEQAIALAPDSEAIREHLETARR